MDLSSGWHDGEVSAAGMKGDILLEFLWNGNQNYIPNVRPRRCVLTGVEVVHGLSELDG